MTSETVSQLILDQVGQEADWLYSAFQYTQINLWEK